MCEGFCHVISANMTRLNVKVTWFSVKSISHEPHRFRCQKLDDVMTEGLDCDNWGIQSAQLKTREPKSHYHNNWEAENAIKYFLHKNLSYTLIFLVSKIIYSPFICDIIFFLLFIVIWLLVSFYRLYYMQIQCDGSWWCKCGSFIL